MSGDTVTKKMALTVGDVADRLQVSQPIVKDLLRQSALVGRCCPIGWHITESDLQNVLQAAANIEANTWRRSLK